ncbi:hypothetical protein JKF63_05294 [Porcisia hertigi]|uniref:Protein kinase domain-containing protein n=1 Tax=Porcisia hertigi TaxID=2761500 RepID=A0A836IYC1_9TRYP|nr:hypothetical protein JKF63_05294 [Porcisia hertigi]
MSSSPGNYYQQSGEQAEVAPCRSGSDNVVFAWSPSERLSNVPRVLLPQYPSQVPLRRSSSPVASPPQGSHALQHSVEQQNIDGAFPRREAPPQYDFSFSAQNSHPPLTLCSTQSCSSGEHTRGSLPHQHTDTYEKPLPPEAFGARQLIEYLFTPDYPGRPLCSLSPPSVVARSSPREIGWPLPLLAEPVSPSTGRRLVFFGKGQQPQFILAERNKRFIAVLFKPLLSAAAAAAVGPIAAPEEATEVTGYTSYGTVLGYSDDNTKIVWQDRSEQFASYVPLSSIQTIHRAFAMQCKHCGLVLLKEELREHTNTHKKGSGIEYGVFWDDESLGMLCGDSGLMQNLTSPQRLGEGAQGVVDLMKVVQPTTADLAHAGSSSAAYRFVSEQLSDKTQLEKVVVKSMPFSSEAKALDEYQKSVRFMTVMQHPHLVEYLAVQLKPDHRTVCICMPYYQEGDVAAMIRNFRGNHFDEDFVRSVALQLSLALAFLHERNPPIVHGDLKAENVMFYNNKQQIVLMDLDASREVLVGYQEAVQSSLGTTAYMAPETLRVERLMPSSDMWSLGVFLYVLTVLPDFPMILNPNTENLELLNADCWATEEDLRAVESYSRTLRGGHSSSSFVTVGSGNSGITLGECVLESITSRGFSRDLAQLVVDLLSYNPLKRPTASAVGSRLTKIMVDCLLQC